MFEKKVEIDSKGSSGRLLDRLQHPHAIFVVNETISEHSCSLVSPQSEGLISSLDRVCCNKANTLHNLAKISQVESVVGLDWGRFEITLDLLVNLEGSVDNLRVEVCDFSSEFSLSEEPFKNACENGLHRVIVKGSQRNDVEMAL